MISVNASKNESVILFVLKISQIPNEGILSRKMFFEIAHHSAMALGDENVVKILEKLLRKSKESILGLPLDHKLEIYMAPKAKKSKVQVRTFSSSFLKALPHNVFERKLHKKCQ